MKQIISLFFLFFLTCQNIGLHDGFQEYDFDENIKLKFIDGFHIKSSSSDGSDSDFGKITSEEGICKISNDTISIKNGTFNLGLNKNISLFINRDKYKILVEGSSCTDREYEKVIKSKLTLNKKNFKLNDTIIGHLKVESTVEENNSSSSKETTLIDGYFIYRIREASYNRDVKRQEWKYQKFIELSGQRPDTITSLDLGDCGLKKLPNEIILFKNLKKLSISDADLSNADLSLLTNLSKIEVLDIGYCNLTKVPEEIFNFKNLIELDLRNNSLKELPVDLFKITTLKRLDIGMNNFMKIPDEIGNLKNLEYLNVHKTPLKIFPQSILELTKLKKIRPSYNMTYFPPKLAKCLYDRRDYYKFKKLKLISVDIPYNKKL